VDHLVQHDRSPRTIGAFVVGVVVVLAGTFTPVPELVAGLASVGIVAATVVDPRSAVGRESTGRTAVPPTS
jgi:hypothetical protein